MLICMQLASTDLRLYSVVKQSIAEWSIWAAALGCKIQWAVNGR
jgi:hypothetical protein